ncbi:MAG: fibronectin type III domain-containing protein [Flavobacteriales bacterium]|nr:fibronectin type III domain-containing protein [Flavobacteriales bacterium]
MRLIKADLHDLNATQLADRGEWVVSKMDGNLNFPTPVPALPTVTTALAKLKTAIILAESRALEAIDARDLAAADVRILLTQLCEYVNFTSGTDLGVAITSGFEPVRKPEPITLGVPVKVMATVSEYAECVDLDWQRVPGATMYHVYMGEGDPATITWNFVGASTRRNRRVAGLVSGKLYSFRIAAVGAAGEGPASEIVSSRAA